MRYKKLQDIGYTLVNSSRADDLLELLKKEYQEIQESIKIWGAICVMPDYENKVLPKKSYPNFGSSIDEEEAIFQTNISIGTWENMLIKRQTECHGIDGERGETIEPILYSTITKDNNTNTTDVFDADNLTFNEALFILLV